VFRAGSADEGGVADPQHLPQLLEVRHDLVGVFNGLYPEGFRLPLDLQPVFVTAGDELDIKAVGPFVPGDGVGNGGAVGMSNVQVGAGIVNGRRNIKSRFRHGHSPLSNKNNALVYYHITNGREMHEKGMLHVKNMRAASPSMVNCQ